MKTLIMLTAIPASGKSTWAKKYQATHDNVMIVSSDQIRHEITGSYTDHTKQDVVWATFDKRIHEYAQNDGVTVILDALNDTNEVRLKYLTTTPEFDKKILVIFPLNVDKSQFYNTQRDKAVVVPPDILNQLADKFEKPSNEVLSYIDEVINVEW